MLCAAPLPITGKANALEPGAVVPANANFDVSVVVAFGTQPAVTDLLITGN